MAVKLYLCQKNIEYYYNVKLKLLFPSFGYYIHLAEKLFFDTQQKILRNR